MMKWDDQLLGQLDEAFEPTPEAFHQSFQKTVTELATEQPKRMRRGLRLALAAALCIVLLCGAALALNRLGVVYFLTERVYNGPEAAHVETGTLQALFQSCDSTLVQADVRDLWMQGERLAICFHLSPKEPERYCLLSETDIGTDGEHFDRIWWKGETYAFDQWLPEGKQMLVISPQYMEIGGQRLPVSTDWLPEEQGETFLMEADLSRIDGWNEGETLTVQAVLNASVHDSDVQETVVLSATVQRMETAKEEQP